MNKHTCIGCFYEGHCISNNDCEYYTPLNDDFDDSEYIEEQRREFQNFWFSYMEEEFE